MEVERERETIEYLQPLFLTEIQQTVNKFSSGFSFLLLSHSFNRFGLCLTYRSYFFTLSFISRTEAVAKDSTHILNKLIYIHTRTRVHTHTHNHFEYMSGPLTVVIRIQNGFNYRNRAGTTNLSVVFPRSDRPHTITLRPLLNRT